MTHQWHDTYRHIRTPAHHLDPRSKLFVGLLFVGAVLFTPHIHRLQGLGYLGVLAAAALFSQVSLRPLLGRVVSIFPFALIMLFSAALSHLSLDHFLQVLAKSMLSIAAMTLVAMTTPFPDFLRALQQCRTPRLLVLFLAFLYRYGAVLGKEALRLERGWSARYFGKLWLQQWQRLGHVLAALLIRSYERAERIYAAMLARGFSNDSALVHLLHFGIGDLIFVGISIAALGFIHGGRF